MTTTDNPLFSLFGSDTNLETAGVWVWPVGEAEGKPAFKIARAGGANEKFTTIQQNELRPYSRLLQASRNKPTAEVLKLTMEATRKAFLGACMLDWKNVMNIKGESVAFTKQAADDLFKQLPSLYEDLLASAQSLATFQQVDPEDEAGNL